MYPTSRSKVIYFRSYCPDTYTDKHTYLADCSTKATKVVSNDACYKIYKMCNLN